VDPFSPQKLADVQGFNCGSDPWETELSDWIKGDANVDDTALGVLRLGTSRVWLYRLPSTGEVVGFSSLGTSQWSYPKPKDDKITVSILPNVAVQSQYHGKPDNVTADMKYSAQIMGHLLYEARILGNRILGLFVDAQNAKARAFYERKIGFKYLDDPSKGNR